MNKHRQLLSCSFRKFILKSVLSHSSEVCMTGLNNDDDDDNNRNNFLKWSKEDFESVAFIVQFLPTSVCVSIVSPQLHFTLASHPLFLLDLLSIMLITFNIIDLLVTNPPQLFWKVCHCQLQVGWSSISFTSPLSFGGTDFTRQSLTTACDASFDWLWRATLTRTCSRVESYVSLCCRKEK